MYGCESWTIKKTEHQRIDDFKLGCWRRLLRESSLGSKIKSVNPKGNQSWISLEELMLKLKLQYFGYVIWRADSFERTLMLGKIEGRKIRGQQKTRWLESITDSMAWVWASSRREAWHAEVHGIAKSQTQLSDWTELNWTDWAPKSLWMVTAAIRLKDTCSVKRKLWQT